MAKNTKALKIPDVFRPLFEQPKRKNILHGGRGSAKSWTAAIFCIVQAMNRKVRVLCTREFQKSIAESVHNLLSKCIEEMEYSAYFTITQNKITCFNGSEFIFAGVRTNVDEIKSMEGIDICWIEEGQSMSQYSLDILIPTIRKPGSMIIITFNPYRDDDPVYTMAKYPDDDTLVIEANYPDNPFFPDVLRKEMERDKELDFDKYEWVWLGKCKGISEAQIFRGKYEVRAFDVPPGVQFLYGGDWGFAQDPTTVVRSFIVGNTLYIDQEAWGVGVELDDLPSFYNSVEGTSLWPIPTDNSRPETISFMKSKGFNVYGAEKWNGSVEDGIAYLKNFTKIVIHPRCVHTKEEFDLYQYKVERQTGEILRIPVDKYNHCIDAIRYAHVNRMRSQTSGSVYTGLSVKSIVAPFDFVGVVYTGTFASPGRILTVSIFVSNGALFVTSDYAINGEFDFDRITERFSKACRHVWIPFCLPEELNPSLLLEAANKGIEPASGTVFPAEGEGVKLINRLLSNNALRIADSCFSLIGALTERTYRMEGKLENSRNVTEMVHLCELFEYTVWRVQGRIA